MIFEIFGNFSLLLEKEQINPVPQTIVDGNLIQNRGMLLSWMSEVCDSQKYAQKTTQLAIRYVIDYLSKTIVAPQWLQLLGITAIFISMKLIEQSNAQDLILVNFIHQSSEGYTLEQGICMEVNLTQALHWNLNLVTPSDYIDELDQVEQIERSRLDDVVLFMMMTHQFPLSNYFEIFMIALLKIYPQMVSKYVPIEYKEKLTLLVQELNQLIMMAL